MVLQITGFLRTTAVSHFSQGYLGKGSNIGNLESFLHFYRLLKSSLLYNNKNKLETYVLWSEMSSGLSKDAHQDLAL